MEQVPIVTAAGASMRDYCLFWLCIVCCFLIVCWVLHRDLQAIATALTRLK